MSKMMDECFKARMESECGRFPLQEFREQFVKQFAEHGFVLIQGSTYFFDKRPPSVMSVEYKFGFLFSQERFINIAVGLCRR